MKKKRFLRRANCVGVQQAANGVPVRDVCRQVGVAEQTFYRWKKEYGGMLPSEARELKQLREKTRNSNGSSPTCHSTRSCCRTSSKKSSEARQATRSDAVLGGPI